MFALMLVYGVRGFQTTSHFGMGIKTHPYIEGEKMLARKLLQKTE